MAASPRVLVLACDPAIASLVAEHLLAVGAQPCCADAGEVPEHAIERTRPTLVLLDCDHDAAGSELFRRHAARVDASIVLFSQSRDDRYVAELADAELIPWFGFPLERWRLELLIRAAGRVPEAPRYVLPDFRNSGEGNRLEA